MKSSKEISNHLNLNARPELLEIIDSISDLKNIKEVYLFSMMEDVLGKIALATYGSKYNIRAKIYKSNGAIVIEKVITVVEEVEDPFNEISLLEAQAINPDYQIGSEIIEELPALHFNRSMMQKSLNMLNRSIKEFEKKREYELYKDSVGDLVSGTVKRNEFGNIVIDLGNNAEGFIPKGQTSAHEKILVGENIRALIIDVKENLKGSQIILSRTHDDFVVKLFFQEIPEIFDGIVTIKAIARDPGSRTKIIVDSENPSIDPVGVCIGFKGAKIYGIIQELKGEKVDLIKYSDQFLKLVINTFYPVEILKVIVNEEKETLSVVVNKSQLSMVIGRGGQNIKLASKLLKWHIEVITEEDEKDQRQKATQEKIKAFMEALDVDEVVAHLLILEGLNSVEALANAEVSAVTKIEDFTDDIAEELINRAKVFKQQKEEEKGKALQELKIEKDLIDFPYLKVEPKIQLGKANITTLSNLADLSSFELAEILASNNINMKEIENIIMQARQQVMGNDLSDGRE